MDSERSDVVPGGATNLYEYLNGDPINRIDPTGLQPAPYELGPGARSTYSECVDACSAAADAVNQCVPGDWIDACGNAGQGHWIGQVCQMAQQVQQGGTLGGFGACVTGCILGGANPLMPPCPNWFTEFQCAELGWGGYGD